MEHHEGRKNNRKFSKLCLMVEAQIISLSDVVLKVLYIEEIIKTILNERR